MDQESRNDLKVSGAGSVAGGIYKNVEINGSASVNGDIDCILLKVNGASDFSGNVKAEAVKINGTGSIKGKAEFDTIKVNGSADMQNGVSGKSIKTDGSIGIHGDVSAEDIRIRGDIRIDGNCDAEIFDIKGAFTVNGLLNAGSVLVELYGPSNAKEIGGEKISIRKREDFPLAKLIKSIFLTLDARRVLNAESIEGDDIYLEHTKAKVVRGNNVNIGAGCEIELVEYKDNFEQAQDAVVKDARKTVVAV